LATLKEACRGHDDVRIYLYDDGSLTILPDIVREMKNVQVVQMFGSYQAANNNESTPRYKYVINDMFERTDEDHIFIADSDAAFHPQAIRAIKEMIEDIPEMGMGGIFNAVHAGDGNRYMDDKYVHKTVLGMFCTVLRREVWEKYGHGIMKSFDMSLTSRIEQDPDWHVRVTFKSFVEHLGHSGMHNRGNPDRLDYIDRAKRFFDEDD
jgi:hypothetical protein